MRSIADTGYMFERQTRNLARQPWYIAFTLLQPILYLVLFGQLFKRVVELPGFDAGSYLVFLAPGIVLMTALFSGGWSGMGVINDQKQGVIDRFLVSPVSRPSLVTGTLVHLALVSLVQSLIVVGLALAMGARFPGGPLGVTVMIGLGILLAAPFGALSIALGLVLRKEESVIGASNFILLPLTFLSSVFMAQLLMPGWMQGVARYNPLNWAVQASREALSASPDWGSVGLYAFLLATFTAVCAWLAVRALGSYRRSI